LQFSNITFTGLRFEGWSMLSSSAVFANKPIGSLIDSF